MESDIIADEFSLSDQMYGLWYMSVIDDNDSFVMAVQRQVVLYAISVKMILHYYGICILHCIECTRYQ